MGINKRTYEESIEGKLYRKCTKCQKVFEVNDINFYKIDKAIDGHVSWCKKCCSQFKKERNGIRKPNIDWTDDKIKKLKEAYPSITNYDLAVIFNTTVRAIESMAHRFELKKNGILKRKVYSKKTFSRSNMTIQDGTIFLYMPLHPFCDAKGYIVEHRYVMEQKLKRYLINTEIVIHKDGDKGNNDPENLLVKYHRKLDVVPEDVLRDRKNGMTISAIKEKYHITNNTYYSKIKKAKKVSD